MTKSTDNPVTHSSNLFWHANCKLVAVFACLKPIKMTSRVMKLTMKITWFSHLLYQLFGSFRKDRKVDVSQDQYSNSDPFFIKRLSNSTSCMTPVNLSTGNWEMYCEGRAVLWIGLCCNMIRLYFTQASKDGGVTLIAQSDITLWWPW